MSNVPPGVRRERACGRAAITAACITSFVLSSTLTASWVAAQATDTTRSHTTRRDTTRTDTTRTAAESVRRVERVIVTALRASGLAPIAQKTIERQARRAKGRDDDPFDPANRLGGGASGVAPSGVGGLRRDPRSRQRARQDK